MPTFGGHSLKMLKDAHPDLRRVMELAIQSFDFMVIQSSRTQEEQEADFRKGTTKAHWLQSPHDYNPSLAVDCAPLPLDWHDLSRFRAMSAVILECGRQLFVPITWGANFTNIKDFPHFELSRWRDIAKQRK